MQAPSEAEAQCAELCRGGLVRRVVPRRDARCNIPGNNPQVYGAGSEDMDTLTFNSPRMLKHLTFSEQRKLPVDIIELADVLAGLELSMDQFIDVCMLSGCDYLEPLKKVAAKTALKLVREHGDIDGAVAHLRAGKNPPPDEWPYEAAKELFRSPDVLPAADVEVRYARPAASQRALVDAHAKLKWTAPDVDGLVEFLVTEKGFKCVWPDPGVCPHDTVG